jgi:hypothetical protein
MIAPIHKLGLLCCFASLLGCASNGANNSGVPSVPSPRIKLLCDPVVVALDDSPNKNIVIEEYVWGDAGGGKSALYGKHWHIPANDYDKEAVGTEWKKVTRVNLSTAPDPAKPPRITILPRPKATSGSGGEVKISTNVRTPTPIRRLVYTPLQSGLPDKNQQFDSSEETLSTGK